MYKSSTGYLQVLFTSLVYSVQQNVIPTQTIGWITWYHNCYHDDRSTNQMQGTITVLDGDYERYALCSWLISSPSTISLNFSRFDTEYLRDYVSIYQCTESACSNKNQIGSLSGSLSSGTVSSETVYTSSTGYLLIIFQSDHIDTEPKQVYGVC